MIDIHGRAIRSRIDRWREEGLIDDAAAGRLLAFEATSGRPAHLSATTAIGATSLALGVIALVSANWDALPVAVKLGGHVLLNLGLGAWVVTALGQDRRPGDLRAEVLLLLLSASTLALLAHIGQSFQLQGDAFGLLLSWLALVTPFTLAYARWAAHRWLWTLALFATAAAGLEAHGEALADAGQLTTAAAVFLVAGYAAPLLTHGRGALEVWGRSLNTVMLIALVLLTSASQILWRFEDLSGDASLRVDVLTGAMVAALGLLAAQAAWRGLGRERPGPLPMWFAVFVVASPLYAALPMMAGGAGSAFGAAVGFCLYWAAIAQLAHAGGRTGIYRFAVVVIALRVFVVFLEAFGGLLLTGVGLVVTGLLLLGFGYVVRVALSRTGGKAGA